MTSHTETCAYLVPANIAPLMIGDYLKPVEGMTLTCLFVKPVKEEDLRFGDYVLAERSGEPGRLLPWRIGPVGGKRGDEPLLVPCVELDGLTTLPLTEFKVTAVVTSASRIVDRQGDGHVLRPAVRRTGR